MNNLPSQINETDASPNYSQNRTVLDAVKGVNDITDYLGEEIYDVDNTDVSTSGTGEDDLNSTVIPGGFLGASGGLKVIAAGTKSESNGNKTLKFYFGDVEIDFHAAANNTNDWRLEVNIFNVTAAIQRITWVGYDGATPLTGYEAGTVDTSADVTMKVTGECAHADDTITQTMWIVELKR